MPILYKLFQKIEQEKTLSNSFQYYSNIGMTLISKPNKNITRKLQTNIPYEYICKNSQHNTSKPNPAYRQIDRQIDRQTDRQIDKAGRQMKRPSGISTRNARLA